MMCFGLSALLYLFFDMAQLDFKETAKARMEQGTHLQTITIPLSEFNDNKHQELWFGGKLYDVHSYVIVNNTVVISVFQDDDEAQLVKNIVDSFNPNDTYNSSDNLSHIIKHHIHNTGGAKILVSPWRIGCPASASSHFSGISNSPYAVTVYFDVIKPPPRFLAGSLC